MSNKNRRDYTLIYKPKVGTPPVTRPLPIDSLSPAFSHTMFIVAITAVPRRNRTPCRVNNLPPLATRSRTYLTGGAYTCRLHAKEPLNQQRYTICVNVSECSLNSQGTSGTDWVQVFDSAAAGESHIEKVHAEADLQSKHCCSVKHCSQINCLLTSPYRRHSVDLRMSFTAYEHYNNHTSCLLPCFPQGGIRSFLVCSNACYMSCLKPCNSTHTFHTILQKLIRCLYQFKL